jgi:hypothetical protein
MPNLRSNKALQNLSSELPQKKISTNEEKVAIKADNFLNNTVTPYEYAILSKHVYGDKEVELPPSWKLYSNWVFTLNKGDISFGYKGAAYKKNNIIVIAHKGSDLGNPFKGGTFNPSDFITDIRILLGDPYSLRSYYEDAFSFVYQAYQHAEHEGLTVYGHTGHSLGGVFAELMVSAFNSQGVAFDTFGAANFIRSNMAKLLFKLTPEEMVGRFVTYNAAPNLINTCNEHSGMVVRLYPDYNPDAKVFWIQQHNMSNLTKQFDPISGDLRISGDMFGIWNKKWPVINMLDWLSEKEFFKNYNANPYYWEEKFDNDGLKTIQRTSEADKVGFFPSYEHTGVIITVSSSEDVEIWGASNFADNI